MNSEIILLLVSALLLTAGAYSWQRGSYLMRHGKKATTIVLDNKAESGGRKTFYYPIIEVETEGKKAIAHKLNIGFESPLPHGTQLDIIYDPDDLDTVELNSLGKLKYTPRLFVAVGVCGLLFVLLEVLEVTQLME